MQGFRTQPAIQWLLVTFRALCHIIGHRMNWPSATSKCSVSGEEHSVPGKMDAGDMDMNYKAIYMFRNEEMKTRPKQ